MHPASKLCEVILEHLPSSILILMTKQPKEPENFVSQIHLSLCQKDAIMAH